MSAFAVDAVTVLAGRSGLPASPDELIEIARADESQQLLVASLYAVPAARYVDPALTFHAEVVTAPWDGDD